MAMDFCLLGNIEAYSDDHPITIGFAQLRFVLAILLIEANRVVSIEHIVELLWGNRRLPHRPRSAVQHRMTLLRQALTANDAVRISRLSAGYKLTVDVHTVDMHQFRLLVRQARTDSQSDNAAALLEQALWLWRGEPFAGLDTPWLNSIRATLMTERQLARLDLNDIQLDMGRHTALLADLADQSGDQPLDERLAGQYLLALYRSGRQAEALDHYQRIRGRLADQLGIDPSPPLRRVYEQILTSDPVLSAPGTSPSIRIQHPPVPRQLPTSPPLFVGRSAELRRLDDVLTSRDGRGDGVPISVISGVGGIGKTWLTLHWARQHIGLFPDGQLYVDLRGFNPSGRPMSSAMAVRGLLDTLGVHPTAIPRDPDAQAALYRSMVADRRLLIVLDNARDAAQVIPLLPGSPTCAVLITSRNRLSGLATTHCARLLTVSELTDPEAHELLATRLGTDRLAAEPNATAELVAYCGGIPLALSIVADRAEAHPDFPLAALAAELRDTTTRLSALDSPDLAASLPAVLSWSYEALTIEQAQVFELLGVAAEQDINVPAVASLTEMSAERVLAVLRSLEQASLLNQHAPGHWRMHDLIRLFAVNRVHHPTAPVTCSCR